MVKGREGSSRLIWRGNSYVAARFIVVAVIKSSKLFNAPRLVQPPIGRTYTYR